ncbi:MAG: CpaF family protein [Myxococcales bacterium]|nr:CpaF family protein [Myxococcales bacterium]
MTMYTESLRAFLKPVLSYLDDETVSEIMINGPEDIWIERKGKLFKTEARFTEEGLLGAARNMAQFVGRPLSDERPRLDARLPDGSRIHVVLPPIAKRGTTISIRKFFKDKLGVEALLKFKSLNQEMGRLIEAVIHTKLNCMVSGGTGSGKTTLLNILSSIIPNEERILTIEDSAELQLNQDHLVTFESRPADKYGKGEVNMGDLLHSALRLRPDRIVVGEVRGGECFHLLQAMNTGHGGSLSTCHANTPTDTLRRLESLCLMSAVELPMVAVRAQVASAINVIICCERLLDGSRKVTHVSEVLPLNDKGEYRTQDIFVFTPVTRDEQGNVLGYHAPTGILPCFLGRARASGFTDLDEKFFDPATYGVPPPPLYNVGEDYSVRWAGSLKHREQGVPDPESVKEQRRAFEHKLKSHSPPERQAAAPARAKPAEEPRALRPSPRPPARPAEASRPDSALRRPRSTGDDDITPAPTRNPLELGSTMDSDSAEPEPGEEQRRRPMPEEPKVEVSEELLSEAMLQSTDVRPAARQRQGTNPGQRVSTGSKVGPAPRKVAREEEPAAAPEGEKTHIKPIPERFRR